MRRDFLQTRLRVISLPSHITSCYAVCNKPPLTYDYIADALIAGRAVQGVGASGMGVMVNTIICDMFSLRDRGLYLAITSVIWAIGSAVGPIIGGVFATQLK